VGAVSTDVTGPIPYPEVSAVLQPLLAELQAVLGEQLVRLYVHGSLASGGFQAGRSDVDLLAVTLKAATTNGKVGGRTYYQMTGHRSAP
jgi:predicted nucleotidyltransferase